MALPLPPHFDPDRVAELWIERAAMLADEADTWSRRHGIRPSSEDDCRVAVLGIDCQVSFCHPGGGLFVPGAVEDSQRTLKWLYRNMHRITEWVLSLDTHEVHQIFHAAYWRSEDGTAPDPMTAITAADVRAGRFEPRGPKDDCIDYLEQLEASGKYVLTIWPYHGLLGGISHALLPAFTEAMLFHGFARDAAPWLQVKGRAPMTEMYSILAPEVSTVGGQTVGEFDEALFAHLMQFDEVYVFGQASSHCVLHTLEDIRGRVQSSDPSALGRFVILEDAMSPVPPPPIDPLPDHLNFPQIATQRLDGLVASGMRRRSTVEALDG